MKAIALIENGTKKGAATEHGLSVYIEYNGRKILLDTGATDLYSGNAMRFGVKLGEVDACVLSHGHYDHSGGFNSFFALNPSAKVYARAEARDRCCCLDDDGKERYIGVPEGLFEKYGDRFVFISDKEKTRLYDGVWLVPHDGRDLSKRAQAAQMYRYTPEGRREDDFMHEQSLVFDTDDGLVIFNSCCHAGAENVVDEIRMQFNQKSVRALIGGFHLMDEPTENADKITMLGATLNMLEVYDIYTGHCTGDMAINALRKTLGEKLHIFNAGDVAEF